MIRLSVGSSSDSKNVTKSNLVKGTLIYIIVYNKFNFSTLYHFEMVTQMVVGFTSTCAISAYHH